MGMQDEDCSEWLEVLDWGISISAHTLMDIIHCLLHDLYEETQTFW